MKRDYGERMVGMTICKTTSESRDRLLEGRNARTSESKLSFTITYYPVLQNVRKSIKKTKVFPEIPILGFQNGKSLNFYLVRAAYYK